VLEAPQPPFARFGGSNHRMPAEVIVFGGVLVFGVVAASRLSAGLAGTQMHPPIAGLDALNAHGMIL